MTDYETVGRGLAPAVKRDGRRDQLRSRSALNLSQLERREGRLRRPGNSDRLAPRPARTEAVFRTGRALPASGQPGRAHSSRPLSIPVPHRRAPKSPTGPRAPWMEERDSSKPRDPAGRGCPRGLPGQVRSTCEGRGSGYSRCASLPGAVGVEAVEGRAAWGSCAHKCRLQNRWPGLGRLPSPYAPRAPPPLPSRGAGSPPGAAGPAWSPSPLHPRRLPSYLWLLRRPAMDSWGPGVRRGGGMAGPGARHEAAPPLRPGAGSSPPRPAWPALPRGSRSPAPAGSPHRAGAPSLFPRRLQTIPGPRANR
ncbi:hypothetical protein P7K49_002320 [Saguinus oedipus]|uniref:Uncharacterized protein n=1 Tax=Saguinus oedipus TaxID=9490 RepID=A0ABQ9WH29_SAGOE|nr:hypothetical protein P7K49_002320 [Saguinus oedipus]